jgi:hypothetical protein
MRTRAQEISKFQSLRFQVSSVSPCGRQQYSELRPEICNLEPETWNLKLLSDLGIELLFEGFDDAPMNLINFVITQSTLVGAVLQPEC